MKGFRKLGEPLFSKGLTQRLALGTRSVAGGVSDTTAPTVAITTNATSPTESTTIAATITFSEEVTGFVVGDISITAGGSLASFATADNIVFTVNWTLAAGANTMDIAAGVCTDAAGNANTAATQYAITNYPIKINDAFTDANNTDLASHTIAPTNVPSAVWVNTYTTGGRLLNVQSNRASCPAFLNDGMYGMEIAVTDYIITTVNKLAADTSTAKIGVRMDGIADTIVSQRNGWYVIFGNGKLEIYERNNEASGTLRATTNLTTTAGTDYNLRVLVAGTTIKASVNGANEITYASMSTHLTSTKIGWTIQTPGGSPLGSGDDFKVFF